MPRHTLHIAQNKRSGDAVRLAGTPPCDDNGGVRTDKLRQSFRLVKVYFLFRHVIILLILRLISKTSNSIIMIAHWYVYVTMGVMAFLLSLILDKFQLIKSKPLRNFIVIMVSVIIAWVIFDLLLGTE